ncbi:hypothetical protein PDJAM_G00266860 [Pangasius djambal]|nr:hypothetical protein [Pangasius djambal]
MFILFIIAAENISSVSCCPDIELPNEQARLDILKIHSGPITKHGDIDYEAIVKLSDGFNGADLRNVCTEAGKLNLTHV